MNIKNIFNEQLILNENTNISKLIIENLNDSIELIKKGKEALENDEDFDYWEGLIQLIKNKTSFISVIDKIHGQKGAWQNAEDWDKTKVTETVLKHGTPHYIINDFIANPNAKKFVDYDLAYKKIKNNPNFEAEDLIKMFKNFKEFDPNDVMKEFINNKDYYKIFKYEQLFRKKLKDFPYEKIYKEIENLKDTYNNNDLKRKVKSNWENIGKI